MIPIGLNFWLLRKEDIVVVMSTKATYQKTHLKMYIEQCLKLLVIISQHRKETQNEQNSKI